MTGERWRRMESIFQSALDRDPTERDSYLEEACGGDQELCAEMRALLAGHDDSAFLRDDAVTLALRAIEKRAAFEPGQHVGPYRIETQLATGGMGLVYRAFDTRLQRPVALKVLRVGLLGKHGRAMLKREAQSIAQLQHPNICALHDFGEQDGREYLVMEYLAGGTLAERLKRGPLELRHSLEYATQIAAALEQAHRCNITHRDLKPGNIMITKTGAKLLDFGLAALRLPVSESGVKESGGDVTLTGTGAGTPLYMAPEQIRGDRADARSDIFSFGLVLYEMLSGQRAFSEKPRAEPGAALSNRTPPSVPGIPASLQRVLSICLAQDPDERWQSAGDLKRELIWISGSIGESARPIRRIWRAAAVICVALGVLASGWAGYRLRSIPRAQSVRFSLPAPPGATYPSGMDFAISPDGEQLVFNARASDGKTMLWLRPLNQLSAHVIPGSEDARFPFWSPDSRTVAFVAKGSVWRVDPAGSTVQKIIDAPSSLGGAWGPEDNVLFTPAALSTLQMVSGLGGTPATVTAFDKSFEDVVHKWPSFLPDGRHFLFSAFGSRHLGMLYVGSVDSKKAKFVLKSPGRAHYRAGRLYFIDGGLKSQAFDLTRLELTGEPVTIAESVYAFDLSQNGTLVYRSTSATMLKLVWLDQNGKQLSKPFGQGPIVAAAVSPDGKTVATVLGPRSAVSISLMKLPSLQATPLTHNVALNAYPVWSPDGKKLAYASNRTGHQNIFVRSMNGSDSEEAVAPSDTEKVAESWSPEGRYLSVTERVGTVFQIWIIPVAEPHKQFRFSKSNFSNSMGLFSPDGNWIAYWSDEPGHAEIFVSSFPGAKVRRRISTDGGTYPQWRHDGKELYYANGKRQLIAVAFSAHGGTIDLGRPRPIAEVAGGAVGPPYSTTRDGRLLAVVDPDASQPRPIVVVTNITSPHKEF